MTTLDGMEKAVELVVEPAIVTNDGITGPVRPREEAPVY